MDRQRRPIAIFLLSVTGLITSIYLTYLHHQIFTDQLTDFSFCGISRAISCETVTASPQAEWFGVPLAWYGAMYYLLILILSLFAWPKPDRDTAAPIRLIFLLAGVALAIDLYLAYTMVFVIGSLCLLCLLTYFLNLGILYLAYRTGEEPVGTMVTKAAAGMIPGKARTGIILSFVLVAVLGVLGAHQLRQAIDEQLAGFDEAGYLKFRASAARIQVDIGFDPYLGPSDADLTIVEFSDFQCPFCRNAHLILQTVLPAYQDRVKLVFKNLPLGLDCNPTLQKMLREVHPNACKLARLGEVAARQGKFWPLHDLIFERQPEFEEKKLTEDDLLDLAREASLDVNNLEARMNDPAIKEAVSKDVKAAIRAGIQGTPTFLFNGLLIKGMPSPKVLQRIIEIELEAAASQPRRSHDQG
jgi:protein-disulfide isomerase/uncharacterized membrane protein